MTANIGAVLKLKPIMTLPEEAKQIATRIKEAFPLTEIQIHPLSPVFVTQGGPACVALQYIEK